MAILEKGNPYSHFEWRRESKARAKGESCTWCGQKPRVLYKYQNRKGWFCNMECASSYHDDLPRRISWRPY